MIDRDRARAAAGPCAVVLLATQLGCVGSVMPPAPSPAGDQGRSPTASSARLAPAAPVDPAPSTEAGPAAPRPAELPLDVDIRAASVDTGGAGAPCDLARPYRGRVGDGGLSVVLTRTGSTLRGAGAYDAGFAETALVGAISDAGEISLTESVGGTAAGTFRGTCDGATGRLRGQWTQGKATKPFELAPRPSGSTPLVERGRSSGNVDPDAGGCHWNVKSPAVFGLGDVDRARRINEHLRIRFPDHDEADMARRVAACPGGSGQTVLGYYAIEANERGLLSVLSDGYVSLGPTVHGDFNAAAAAVSIDIPTGRRLALADLVTSPRALRPIVKSCMKLAVDAIGAGDEWWLERDIQGVPSDANGDPAEEGSPEFVPTSVREPSFLVLPDGLAVLIRNQPTVSSYLELRGPVIRWGALARAGLLDAKSPLSRLWAGQPTLAAGEPACTRLFSPGWLVPSPPAP